MRTIIAGSRSVNNLGVVLMAIKTSGFKITTVISGNAPGVDALGEFYAKQYNIPLELYPAAWEKQGRGAGKVRNLKMAQCAQALIAVWDGRSPGTAHMIRVAKQMGLQVYVHHVGAAALTGTGS